MPSSSSKQSGETPLSLPNQGAFAAQTERSSTPHTQITTVPTILGPHIGMEKFHRDILSVHQAEGLVMEEARRRSMIQCEHQRDHPATTTLVMTGTDIP
ncbi:uncharacterized protein N7479_011414 [Penicillium vulpinum]|uniref:uncharacterized protein n=1 Tax=Penicillium vulpinum TaxID=29845 RepID=UPI002546677E|nr:uncharacterized protein N7479_011414 [Penicillium vulpinum]KAJ5953001.1 hypothetical protein N7479_011414 [Penicillium vulpinum]